MKFTLVNAMKDFWKTIFLSSYLRRFDNKEKETSTHLPNQQQIL